MLLGLIGLIGLFATLNSGEMQRDSAQSVRIMTVEQRMIVRVPVRIRQNPLLDWEENKKMKCFPARTIAGAYLTGPDTVDFILRSKHRIRAKLDSDCDGLDFYSGIYLQPESEEVCAGRDEIRSRAGNSCRIRKLHTLVPSFDSER